MFLIWVTQTIAHQTSNLVFGGLAACRICVTVTPYKNALIIVRERDREKKREKEHIYLY